jgi:hypothetical protein
MACIGDLKLEARIAEEIRDLLRRRSAVGKRIGIVEFHEEVRATGRERAGRAF